jgi:hypothetical protein
MIIITEAWDTLGAHMVAERACAKCVKLCNDKMF